MGTGNKYIKVNLYSLLFGLLGVMPVVDSVSGAFHESYPIGQIYRIIFFVYILFLLMKNSRNDFLTLVVAFFLFIGIQIVISISGGYIAKSIQDTIKLFTPIFMISLFQVLLKKGKIKGKSVFNLLDLWSVIYPLLIIVPSALGLSSTSYGDNVGFKGFFYATNEISFIMSSLVLYRFYRLSKELNSKSLIVLALNVVCLLLMGTKTGYASIAVGSLLFVITVLKTRKSNKKFKAIIILIAVAVVVVLLHNRIIDMTFKIFERWFYQRQLSYSTIDFLFSMRLRRLSNVFATFVDGLYFLFGWGFGAELGGMGNVEMDFIDLLLKTGIVGFLYVFIFYYYKVKSVLKNNSWGALIIIWSFALAFGAGHVLFYGQSGMMLALNVILATLILQAVKSGKNRKENEVLRIKNYCVYSHIQ